jgi:hypothetical protein
VVGVDGVVVELGAVGDEEPEDPPPQAETSARPTRAISRRTGIVAAHYING